MAVAVLTAILPPASRHICWVVSAGLAQVSEFSFVLSSRARRAGIISREVSGDGCLGERLRRVEVDLWSFIIVSTVVIDNKLTFCSFVLKSLPVFSFLSLIFIRYRISSQTAKTSDIIQKWLLTSVPFLSGVPAGPQRHHPQFAPGSSAVVGHHAQTGSTCRAQDRHMTELD